MCSADIQALVTAGVDTFVCLQGADRGGPGTEYYGQNYCEVLQQISAASGGAFPSHEVVSALPQFPPPAWFPRGL